MIGQKMLFSKYKYFFLHFPHELLHFFAPKNIFLGGFSGFKPMAMGFLLECLHKVDLVNFQCPNGENDLNQLKIYFLGDTIYSYAKNMYILLGFNHVWKGLSEIRGWR